MRPGLLAQALQAWRARGMMAAMNLSLLETLRLPLARCSRRQAFALSLGALWGGAQAQPPVSAALTLGTATPGGGFPVYGEALVRALAATDPGLIVQTRATRGSNENIPLLESGQLDLALVQGEALHEALSGVGRPPARLSVVAAMYPTAGMFVVRADSPYRRIADLRGQPVAWGAQGSGLVILARYVLDGLGLDMTRDFQSVYLARAGDGPALLRDGRVAALWGGGAQWPGFVAVTREPPGGRFIVPSSEEVVQVLARHRFLRPQVLPAGAYAGQETPLTSVGSWSFIMARPDLDAERVYRFTRALHLSEALLASALPQAADTRAQNTAQNVPDPALLHPGTRRYLQEIGLLR